MSAFDRFHFLIVDDDEVDVMAVTRVLAKIDKGVAFSVAQNGEEGLAALRARSGAEAPEQTVVLLDLNMPRMNGHEFLEHLSKDQALANTIVFVLSTSTDPRDISKSFENGSAGYLSKEKLGAENFINLFENYFSANALQARA